MAGDWIKWVKGLTRRAEVLAVARKLGKDRRIIACACMEFWEWADDETEDGHIQGATAAFVDDLVLLQGFFGGFEEQGWVRATAQGITILNWENHNGDSAKRRARNQKNQHRSRGDPPLSPPNGDSLFSLLSGYPELNTETFRKEWENYEQHRRENHWVKLKLASVRGQLERLAAMGEVRAIQAIRNSITNGWQGIFEPKANDGGRSFSSAAPAPKKPQASAEVLEQRRRARQWLRLSSENESRAVSEFQTAHPGCGLNEVQLRESPVFQDWVFASMNGVKA